MIALGYITAALLGAYGNRVRGGLYALPGGDLPARALGSLIGAGAVAALAGLGWWSLVIAAAALAGDAVAGADGTYGTPWTIAAFGRMWLYAIERVAPIALAAGLLIVVTHTAPIALVSFAVAVLVCPLCYAFAPYWPVAVPWLGIKARDGADSGFGETVWGAALGLAIFAALGHA